MAKWDVMRYDTDADKIGEVEADTKEEADELAWKQFGHLINIDDLGDCLYVREPYDVMFPGARQEQERKLTEIKNAKEVVLKFQSIKDLFVALYEEVDKRRDINKMNFLKTAPNFINVAPERLEYWEDCKNLLVGFKLCNHHICDIWLSVYPTTIFAIHLPVLSKLSSDEKKDYEVFLNNYKQMANNLNYLFSKVTS